YIDGIREERNAFLQQFLNEIDFPAQRIRVMFKTGNPVDELLKLCLSEDIDMIVMGVKGRTDLESVFVGSVAEKMFRRSPVTIVSYRDSASSKIIRKRIDL
ncbi:MAG: universal stress protein, partial [Desulfobacterales bacterium]|nr:universal stress protein [Desulfobacterales bacterium]MDX2512571.1 universal stress protein [Desulfobacterales bacterium]